MDKFAESAVMEVLKRLLIEEEETQAQNRDTSNMVGELVAEIVDQVIPLS